MRLLRLISESVWPMRDSPQPLVHLEAAVLHMATLEPGETLAQLRTRLEELEQRLSGAPGTASGAPSRGRAQSATPAAPTRAAPTDRIPDPLPKATDLAPDTLRLSEASPMARRPSCEVS